jgi:hypothetical protein
VRTPHCICKAVARLGARLLLRKRGQPGMLRAESSSGHASGASHLGLALAGHMVCRQSSGGVRERVSTTLGSRQKSSGLAGCGAAWRECLPSCSSLAIASSLVNLVITSVANRAGPLTVVVSHPVVAQARAAGVGALHEALGGEAFNERVIGRKNTMLFIAGIRNHKQGFAY